MLKRMLNKIEMEDEERQVVEYGLKKLLMFMTSLLVVAIIGVMTNTIFNLVIFLLFFIPLRIFAGGMHLPSIGLCALSSFSLVFGIALVSKYIKYEMLNPQKLFVMCIIAAMIIILLAPVDTTNKVLYNAEKKRFKRISEIIVFVELFLLVLLYSFEKIVFMICIVLVIESVFLIIQSIINRLGIKTI